MMEIVRAGVQKGVYIAAAVGTIGLLLLALMLFVSLVGAIIKACGRTDDTK